MAIEVKHKFVSAKPDGVDDTVVRPSDWNDTHELTMASGFVLGRASSGAGPVEELDIIAAFGQCRLALDGANLRLSRFNGRHITINSTLRVIPTEGVTLAPTGLSANTTYYIYAEWTGTAVALLASTTAPVTQIATGVRVRGGDGARTLVGMERTNASAQWAGLVRSWFNDPGVASFGRFSANRSTTSTTLVEINTEIRIEALLWAGETWDVALSAVVDNNTALNFVAAGIAFDNTNTALRGTVAATSSTANAANSLAQVLRENGLSEGYHFATVLGRVGANTGTFRGGTANADITSTLTGFARR